MAEHGLNQRCHIDRLLEVIDVSTVIPEPSSHHDIFFTSSYCRIKSTTDP